MVFPFSFHLWYYSFHISHYSFKSNVICNQVVSKLIHTPQWLNQIHRVTQEPYSMLLHWNCEAAKNLRKAWKIF